MSSPVLVRRFLVDAGRNPVNLLLLAVVPMVFVIAIAGSLADAAKLLGGTGGVAVETATAGWAAAFLTGTAMYFQTAATRDTDRRLVVAGLTPARLVAGRLATGVALAALASAAALLTLQLRTGLDHPVRAVLGTLMFAVIYLAIGAVIGSLARNPVNGVVSVLFVWILDVFFGPDMGAADRLATQGFPTHFVTLWMVDVPSRHGGRVGDLGWALGWTAAAVAVAFAIASSRVRTRHPRRRTTTAISATAPRRVSRLRAALQACWRDQRRNPALWALFVVVPTVFVVGADAATPNEPVRLILRESGRSVRRAVPLSDVHAATMAPIAIASLAAIVGLFGLFDSREPDRRAILAGLRFGTLLRARAVVLVGTTLFASAVTMLVTALVFDAKQWPAYVAANLLIGATYTLIGAVLAPVFGRVGGVFMAFLLPFLDLGITQSPMLSPEPTALSRLLPGYGGSRILIDSAQTADFDQTSALLIGLLWLTALVALVTIAYARALGGWPSAGKARLATPPASA